MKSSKIENLLKDNINNSNDLVPFYKRKIFFISIGVVLLITIIIIIVVVTSNSNNSFSTDDFKESNSYKNNPDQGFYRQMVVQINPSDITHGSAKPERVYHLRCDISQFSKVVNNESDKELTQIALDKLDELLSKIKSENKNAVIRFSYDPKYNGNTNQEPTLEMIETHIKQLSSVLNKYYHTITAIEAGMLGPWGEMHSSDIATEENKAKVFHYWLQNTNNIPVLARTPKAIFYYFGKELKDMEEEEIKEQDEGYLLGVFNDCYLSSDSDVGTYRYNRTREVNWLSKQNEHLPYGGETCKVHEMSDLDKAIPEMYKLGLSYLNNGYNENVISKWKNLIYNSSFGSDNIFYGISGFDYIKTHMGYRLVIKSFEINYKKGGEFEIVIKIKNVGFGNLLKEKLVDIIFTTMDNDDIISRKNLGKYKGENELKLKGELLSKDHDDYKAFMKIYGLRENNMDYYSIQFANDDIYNENINATYLFQVKKGEIQK